MCRALVKFVLFFVNLIFLLIGLLVVGAGVFVVIQLKTVTVNLPIELNIDFIPYIIIAFGVIVFLISFSGCCGTITETKCLLITYAVCMAVLAAAKIVLTVLVFVKLPDFTNMVENTIDQMFLSDDVYQNATFHIIELQFKCCGTTGPEAYVNDYGLASPTCCEPGGNNTLSIDDLPINNLPINLTTKNVHRNAPIDLTNLTGGTDLGDVDLGGIDLGGIDLGNLPIDIGSLQNLTICKKEDAFETGCTPLLGETVKSIGRSVGIGFIIFIGFELFAMFFTIYLIKTMKLKNPKMKYIEQPRYYY